MINLENNRIKANKKADFTHIMEKLSFHNCRNNENQGCILGDCVRSPEKQEHPDSEIVQHFQWDKIFESKECLHLQAAIDTILVKTYLRLHQTVVNQ